MKRNKISGYIPSPEDSRDYKLSRLIKCSPKLPASYITKRKNIHVFDQDDSNMCVSCAIAAFKQIIESDQVGDIEPFSPAYIYGNRRGSDYHGEGMIPRQALKTLKDYGICHLNYFPGNYTYNNAIKYYSVDKERLDRVAKPYRISSYYRLKTTDEIKQAIYTMGAALVAYSVYDCLLDPDSDGYVEYDETYQGEYHGGHQMLAVGWNETGFIVLNSWSTDYGVGDKEFEVSGGLVLIPYAYQPEEAWAVTDDITEQEILGLYGKKESIFTKVKSFITSLLPKNK